MVLKFCEELSEEEGEEATRIRFFGRRSRCATPYLCISSSVSQIVRPKFIVSVSLSVTPPSIKSYKVALPASKAKIAKFFLRACCEVVPWHPEGERSCCT